MKFNIRWNERHSAVIEAESKEEAELKLNSGNFDVENESSIFTGGIEVDDFVESEDDKD